MRRNTTRSISSCTTLDGNGLHDAIHAVLPTRRRKRPRRHSPTITAKSNVPIRNGNCCAQQQPQPIPSRKRSFMIQRQKNRRQQKQQQQRPMSILQSNNNTCFPSPRMQSKQGFFPVIQLLLLVSCMLCHYVSTAADSETETANWLSKDSVVLIVGAATSLLGSEVALALHRLFHCHVVLIDDLNTSSNGDDAVHHSLGALEFHRQSLFRVWQEMDQQLTLYRMNPRSIVPDIDPGTTVDRLAYVLEKHSPTHVLILSPEMMTTSTNSVSQTFRGESDDAPPRAGLLEGLLEQVRSFHIHKGDSPTALLPRVVWTSSEHVYPTSGTWSEANVSPMPRDTKGANAVVNEVIARAYDEQGVPSVALRISNHIYGPFQEPFSPLFNIMERVIRNEEDNDKLNVDGDSSSTAMGDYLYVDDAVDAVLAALQLPHVPHTFAINVASGNAPLTTDEMLDMVRSLVSGGGVEALGDNNNVDNRRRLRISLAEQILNFHPRVSLTEGLKRSLAWHYDRMFPYGSDESSSLQPNVQAMARSLGIASCTDPSDTECLRGVPILPCASECAHKDQCRETGWDKLLPQLESWTASCSAVLYTIRQTENTSIPRDKSVWPDSHCNIAFVPSTSSSSLQSNFKIRNNWTIVNVPIEVSDVDAWVVPLWSPGKLFPRSQWAIYTAPDIVWDDLDRLMKAVHMKPEGNPGSVALMIGTLTSGKTKNRLRNSSQRQAYRAIHIKATEFLQPDNELYDGFLSNVDAESWVVHRLGHPDGEQLRCDVTKEIVGWKGMVDFHAAANFVFGLHDLWSQVLLKEKGEKSWWHGDNVVSVVSAEDDTRMHRRLQEDGPDAIAKTASKAVEAVALDEEDEAEMQDIHHFDHNGFGTTRKSIGDTATEGSVVVNSEEQEEEDDAQMMEDDDNEEAKTRNVAPKELDPSQYDTWRGVLSSSEDRMFVRIVDPALVGVVFLDDAESFSQKEQ